MQYLFNCVVTSSTALSYIASCAQFLLRALAMEKKIILAIIGVVVVCVLIVLFLQPSNSSTGLFALSSSSSEAVKVGLITPMTGNFSYYGEYVPRGMELAVEEINANGGINGRPISVVIEDSMADPKQGLSAFNKLSSIDGIKLILVNNSDVMMAIAPEAEKSKTVLFGMGGASTNISSAGDYIFRHNILPQDDAKVIAYLMYNKLGCKDIALFIVNAEAGISYSQFFEQEFKRLGGRIVLKELYEKGATDFRTPLTKLSGVNVKCGFAASHVKEVAGILSQTKQLGLDFQWVGMYASETQDLLKIAGDSANGYIFTTFFDIDSNGPRVVGFREKFISQYGKKPEMYSALAYDSLKVLAEAMKRCPDPEDAACIKNKLYKIQDFQGVTGTIAFDANGDTRKSVIVKTVKDGKFVLYESS